MKEVSWGTPIEKAEFVFKREFMIMEHNYLCAICKENSAVQDINSGILQPCWVCIRTFKIFRRKEVTTRHVVSYLLGVLFSFTLLWVFS